MTTTTPGGTPPAPRPRRRPRVVGLAVAAAGVLAVLVLAAGRDHPGPVGPVRLSPAATHLPAAAPGDGPSVSPTSPPPPPTQPVFPFPSGGPPADSAGGPSGFPVPPTSPPFIGPTIPTTTPVTPAVPSGPVVVDPGESGVPAPDPAATDDPGTGGVEKKPGRFDIPGQIRYAINNWFRNLVIDAWNPILNLLSHTLLATPDVTRSGRVASIWSMNAGIANTIFVLFIVAGGAVVMSHDTLQTRHTLKEIAPRLVIGFLAANTSLSILHEGIEFANALSAAFLGQAPSGDAAAEALRSMLVDPLAGAGIFLVLLGLVTAVMAVALLLTYILRIAVFVLLVACAPLALCTHASPYTEGLARLWWRAVLGCFAVQVGQSLTLIVALRVFFNDGATTLGMSAGGTLVNFLIACCLLYILIRIPVWASRMVFAGSVHHRSVLIRLVWYRLLRHP